MERLECGKIVNTHGVRGEVKLEPYIDASLFRKLKEVQAGSTALEITSVRSHGDFLLLTCKGIDTVEAAMPLKGRTVTVPREALPLKKDEYLYQDIYGFDVFDARKDAVIGTLKEVLERPASMLYLIRTESGEVLIPAVKPFYEGVDFEKKQLLLRTIEGMLPDED